MFLKEYCLYQHFYCIFLLFLTHLVVYCIINIAYVGELSEKITTEYRICINFEKRFYTNEHNTSGCTAGFNNALPDIGRIYAF